MRLKSKRDGVSFLLIGSFLEFYLDVFRVMHNERVVLCKWFGKKKKNVVPSREQGEMTSLLIIKLHSCRGAWGGTYVKNQHTQINANP